MPLAGGLGDADGDDMDDALAVVTRGFWHRTFSRWIASARWIGWAMGICKCVMILSYALDSMLCAAVVALDL
jgi:hypothetical protein